jgi:transcription elongation factor Elf1
MPTCPVCDSQQVLMILSATKRAICRDCGARWMRGEAELADLPDVILDGLDEPFSRDAARGVTS